MEREQCRPHQEFFFSNTPADVGNLGITYSREQKRFAQGTTSRKPPKAIYKIWSFRSDTTYCGSENVNVIGGEKVTVRIVMRSKLPGDIEVEGTFATELILGVYSETAPVRFILDTDAFIGKIEGPEGDSTVIELIEDNNEKQEGNFSRKITVSVDGTKGQYAGWFLQWGDFDSIETIDMSDYENGKLTFWVKSPINLEIGIRSGNVRPGDETSEVLLSNYSEFNPDSIWHKISIPLSDFAGPSPKADLSQMKTFFTVASNTPTGGTGGEQRTFWIDDIRWESIK